MTKGADGASGKPPPGILRRRSTNVAVYAVIAAGAFVAALIVLVLMLTQADRLVRLGLAGNLYYVMLVAAALAAAAFLFGVLRSHAAYAGKLQGGALELSGPVVVFVVVIVLGFYLLPSSQSFSLTVFVHGPGGRQDLVLRNTGSVLLDIGGDRRREAIGDKGQAYFPGIPSRFRAEPVSITVEADGYEPVISKDTFNIEGDSAYIAIRPRAAELSGYVRTKAGQPIAGATVTVEGSSARTDAAGFFKLTLPGAAIALNLSMQVTAAGYTAWNSVVVPRSNEISIMLDPAGP